jgi:hypothetical protein
MDKSTTEPPVRNFKQLAAQTTTVGQAALVCAVLLLLAVVIVQATITAVDNEDILEATSFAGTVVGIILAVLAIIYAFMANADQKDDASRVRHQIEKLHETIGKLDIAVSDADESKDEFKEQLVRLNEIRADLAALRQNTDSAVNSMNEARGIIERWELKSVASKENLDEDESKHDDDDEDQALVIALKKIARMSLPDQQILYFVAMTYKSTKDILPLLEKFAFPALKEDGSDFYKTILRAEMSAYRLIFVDMGLFRSDSARAAFTTDLIDTIESEHTTSPTKYVYDTAKLDIQRLAVARELRAGLIPLQATAAPAPAE